MRWSGGEPLEVREARGRAVLAEHLADHRDRREPGEPREVDRGLGVAAPLEHATRAGAQREHVAGPVEVGRAGGRGRGSGGWWCARSAAPMPLPAVDVVDRHRERRCRCRRGRAAPSARCRARRGDRASHGMHTSPRAQRSMKLTASGVTQLAAIVRSPSFSRSSSSTTRTISPRRMRFRASSMRRERHRCLLGIGEVVGRPGRVTTMRQPCGSRRSGWISPPCRSTIHRAMARPRPAPPSLDARGASRRGRSARRRGRFVGLGDAGAFVDDLDGDAVGRAARPHLDRPAARACGAPRSRAGWRRPGARARDRRRPRGRASRPSPTPRSRARAAAARAPRASRSGSTRNSVRSSGTAPDSSRERSSSCLTRRPSRSTWASIVRKVSGSGSADAVDEVLEHRPAAR